MLNEAQKQAVESNEKRILCLAGAGTGKTHVLTQRVARIVEEGLAEPWQILCLTFTRAAGAEMKERIIGLIGEEGQDIFCNTYHAWAARILRQYAFRIGLTPEFTIYDQEDRNAIIERIIDELSYKIKVKDVTDAMDKQTLYRVPITGDNQKIVEEYRSRCKRHNAIDLDGLIAGLQYLLTDERIQEEIRDRYKYIYVDEFQDTDHRQMEILEAINPNNLFVVGDDFQSIYGFRGADVSIIMSMAENPEYETIKLQENYRSTVPIIDAANSLIKHNNQTEKKLISHREGPETDIIHAVDQEDALNFVCEDIRYLNEKGTHYKDIAILGRTNKQIQAAGAALREAEIPYKIKTTAADVLRTQEAKKLFTWMKAIINPQDDEAIGAIINWPRKTAGRQERLKAEMYALENNCSLYTALCATETATGALEIMQSIKSTIEEEYDENEDVYAFDLLTYVQKEAQINEYFNEQGRTNKISEMEQIDEEVRTWQEKKTAMGEPITAKEWLDYYAMMITEGSLPDKDDTDAVQIMTAHGSKGLEFENVFITDCYQGSFPIKAGEIEEERRLFYVAITRAKSRLVIMCPGEKKTWGNNTEKAEKSQFVDELK